MEINLKLREEGSGTMEEQISIIVSEEAIASEGEGNIFMNTFFFAGHQ